MMLKSFVFLCIFIPLLNAIPLKPEASRALLWDHFQVKRISDCESDYVESIGCPTWATKGYCENPLYQDFMATACKATCGRCQAAPTPPPTPPPYSTPEIISFDVSECLAACNLNRSIHGAPALQWDYDLASGSADWSLNLTKRNPISLKHSTGSYGENIYYSATSAIGTVATCTQAVESWYSEIADYDFNNPALTDSTGHFTQVVWKSTTQVGVGIAAVTKDGYTYTFVTARYTPRGNVDTTEAIQENVLAPSK